MKYMCNICEGDSPCIVYVDGDARTPIACPWRGTWFCADAKWEKLEDSYCFEMQGFCGANNKFNYEINPDIKNMSASTPAPEHTGTAATTEPEHTRHASTPEPVPTGKGRYVLSEVMKDLWARSDAGQKKYGTMLRTNNGRDAMMDMYQELLDAAMYAKQRMMEKEDDNLEKKVIEWAYSRGIFPGSTCLSRWEKLLDECNELAHEVFTENLEGIKMEAGDVLVTLVNFLHPFNLDLKTCLSAAYEKIKNRTGHMENGQFIRDKE